MIDTKKAGSIAVMVLASILAILIYWSQHLYYRAAKIEDDESKVKVLNRAKAIYPLNDLVFFELGKAHLNMGIQALYEEGGPKEAYFRDSIRNLERSLMINPASSLSHFYYAQSLYLMDYVAPPVEVDFYRQYKKSALLAGHDNEILYEVGKLFLSRWEKLSEEDKDFTLEILGEALQRENGVKFESLLHVWALNVKDYEGIRTIIQEEAGFLRIYARFLGEMSLRRDERIWALMKAEQIEFEAAKRECAEGDKELVYSRLGAAAEHYERCLERLERIRFYQDLAGRRLILTEEFNRLKKSANLKLAKIRLRQGGLLSDVQEHLYSYLELEDKISEIDDLGDFLQEQGVIGDRLELRVNDLDILAFQIYLYFKRAKYREIIGFERLLKQSFVVVPEEQRKDYVRILQWIGNSYQRAGSLYGAIDFYNEALEIEPDNLISLLGIRSIYERMNDEEEIRNIDRRIERLLSPDEVEMENPQLVKGEVFTTRLIFDGREATLELVLGNWQGVQQTPFLSVVFNGRLVWEDYVVNDVVALPVNSRVGANTLSITSLNRDAIITSIIINP